MNICYTKHGYFVPKDGAFTIFSNLLGGIFYQYLDSNWWGIGNAIFPKCQMPNKCPGWEGVGAVA
jgi:hypothetical protein